MVQFPKAEHTLVIVPLQTYGLNSVGPLEKIFLLLPFKLTRYCLKNYVLERCKNLYLFLNEIKMLSVCMLDCSGTTYGLVHPLSSSLLKSKLSVFMFNRPMKNVNSLKSYICVDIGF